ncbi:MAG: beta-lactamase family protein [Planctomycetes bacterium]|nr:beta-lactamase family protein [Planctomycetota bacterium]
MKRRTFVQWSLATALGAPVSAASQSQRFDEAAEILEKATGSGQISSATMYVKQKETSYSRRFGKLASDQAMFLLGSITKPICVTALMTLFDRGEFKLADRVQKYLPQFQGAGRDQVTMEHLLTHVSGLPDQLPENNALRRQHAGLPEFVDQALRTPLKFAPGTRYQYSSMGILLATEVARVISGKAILEFVNRSVFERLGMKHSALGLGAFTLDEFVPCQTEFAAPEAGAGDPAAKDWDWNSRYWRSLGAPWGGAHASAADLALFLSEFLGAQGQVVQPETARLMVTNRNGAGLTPRGLGFDVGPTAGSPGCSERTFGHTGSTGTLAWADPATDTVCVILTSLPGGAVQPHPRGLASARVAAAVQ